MTERREISSRRRPFRGAIAWMAGNPVAANLAMLFLLIGGFVWGGQIKQEVFPEFTLDLVQVTVLYPGATPEDVVDGIILPIEEAIQGVDGIKEVVSVADEGIGTVRVEADIDTDLQQLATDIKNEVDRIYSFPEDAEEPLVTIPSHKRQVVTLLISGEQNRKVLREITEMVRDRLLQDDNITRVELLGDRPLEISIEVSSETLEAYHLKLAQVAEKVRSAARDIPGGTIRTRGGDILVRMAERKDYKSEFARIPVITRANGTIVTLGEIADIRDDFEDTRRFVFYNRKPALGIDVYRVGDQTPITVSDAVSRQLEELRRMLPAGIHLDTVNDRSEMFRQRISLLLRNGFLGLGLVFILLAVFLEARLAFWVTMGIPISFLGSLLFIPMFDVSISMVSLFAFIVALGIVVDDAIVVGENVYHYKQLGDDPFTAAVKGVREVAVPVTFSVLTNIVAFLPLYFVPGVMGKIFRHIPVVVVSVFAISLLEAVFVLPAHLAHLKPVRNRLLVVVDRWQQKLSGYISAVIRNVYGPFLRFSLKFRYISMAVGIVILMLTLAYVKSGRMGMVMFPKVESDFAYARATLPVGVSVAETLAVGKALVLVDDADLLLLFGRLEGVVAEDLDPGIPEAAAVQLQEFGPGAGQAGHLRVEIAQDQLLDLGVFQDFTGREAVAAAEDQHPSAMRGDAHHRVHQVFVVDRLIAAVELEVAVDVAGKLPGLRAGQDDVLVAGGFAEDDPVAVEVLLGDRGVGAGLDQAGSEHCQPDQQKAQQPAFIFDPVPEIEEQDRGCRQIHQAENEAGFDQGEEAGQQKDPDQGPGQRADVVHLQDLAEIDLELGGVGFVEAGDQRQLETEQQADGADEEVLDQDIVFVGQSVGEQQQQRTAAAAEAEDDFGGDELVEQAAVGKPFLEIGPDAHAEHHHPDHQGPLAGRVAEQVGRNPAQGVFVGEPAAAHDEGGEVEDERGADRHRFRLYRGGPDVKQKAG
jgi:hypothetical protein